MTFLSCVANGSDRERISKLLFAFDFSYGIDGNKSETAYFPRIFFFIINNNYFQGYLKKTRTQKKDKRACITRIRIDISQVPEETNR